MPESRSWRTFMVQETFGRETELDPNFRSHNLQCEGCEGHSFKKKKKYLFNQASLSQFTKNGTQVHKKDR